MMGGGGERQERRNVETGEEREERRNVETEKKERTDGT